MKTTKIVDGVTVTPGFTTGVTLDVDPACQRYVVEVLVRDIEWSETSAAQRQGVSIAYCSTSNSTPLGAGDAADYLTVVNGHHGVLAQKSILLKRDRATTVEQSQGCPAGELFYLALEASANAVVDIWLVEILQVQPA